MTTLRLLATSTALTLALAACSVRDKGEETTSTTQTTETTGVTRDAVAAPAPTPSAPAPAAIQTAAGPRGMAVALNKAAVTGDILTIALTYTGGSCCAYVDMDQVSVIDDATSRRIGVLKDNNGKWMAAPLDTDGKQLRIGYSGQATQVWFKFPAPPATSRTVSLTLPEVAPFDAVPVTR